LKALVRTITELGKVRISLPISLSALTGYILYSGLLDSRGWYLALGVFLMSCGSSVLNHWQEWKTDALMPRTKNRPIPSGKISPLNALFIFLVFVVSGTVVLFFSNYPIAILISWITLFFYNAVYTPLKKITAFAVIPGSFVGALPPLIGWTAAGGAITSETILIVSLFFFIGQIPHFWLLLLLFGEQYKLANMPCLNQIFNEMQLKRITYVWILTTVASALLVALFVLKSNILLFILIFYLFYLLFSLSISIFVRNELNVKQAFYKLNFLYLFMMIFLIADNLNK
jgi:heme o synthase